MTETKWTPGPWAVDRPSDPNQRMYIVREFNWRLVASMENGNKFLAWAEETSANANLIAAAPDMYAALKMVSGMDLHHEVLAVVDAAMRKARGE